MAGMDIDLGKDTEINLKKKIIKSVKKFKRQARLELGKSI